MNLLYAVALIVYNAGIQSARMLPTSFMPRNPVCPYFGNGGLEGKLNQDQAKPQEIMNSHLIGSGC